MLVSAALVVSLGCQSGDALPSLPRDDGPPDEFTPQGAAVGGYWLEIGGTTMGRFMPTFESVDSYSNGPAWDGLAELAMSKDSSLRAITLNSEGSAFYATCPTEEPLVRLGDHFRALAANPDMLREAIQEGRDKGFGAGDL